MKYSTLEELSSNSNIHNLLANIAKFRQLLIEVYGSYNLINGNFRRYYNKPKAPNIEIFVLAFAAESMQIYSENMLYSILKSSYPHYCSTLPDRTNFNRRRRFCNHLLIFYQSA
jgi:hypothetical protein